jgi:hypothetical protein
MKTLILLSCLTLVSAAQAQSPTPIRIASGTTKAYTDSHGNLWSADKNFNVGQTVTFSSNAIKGTPDPWLFQNGRYSQNDSPAMVYTIPTSIGTYTVNLYFSENYVQGTGQRVFNVKVNGAQMLTKFDIFAAAGGQDTAVIKTFVVLSTGTITIEFDHESPAVENPKIDAIELLPIAQGLPNVLLLVNSLSPNASSLLFDDQSVVYVGPIIVQQWGAAGNVIAGAVSVNTSGHLSGSLAVNPNPKYLDANGNMTFLFSIPSLPGTMSQTLSAAEFQQGALGITLNVVVYRAPLFAPKPGVLPQLVLKSFGIGLTP